MLHPHSNSTTFAKTSLSEASVIVLLAQFSDKRFSISPRDLQQTLLAATGKLGKAIDYFDVASGSKFQLEFVFLDKFFSVQETVKHFAELESFAGEEEFANEIIQIAKCQISTAVQSYQLSPNGESVPLLIVHPVPDNNEDGLYSIQYESELLPNHPYALCSLDSLQGTYCHELGHVLFAWPDLYDSKDLDENGHEIDGASAGLGDWCLMASGIGQHPDRFTAPCGWIKYRQQWLDADVIAPNSGQGHSLEPGELARIKIDGDKEYLLLENRVKSGLDIDAWGEGLLIYHVDATALKDNESFPNSDELRPGVRLYQGDGLSDLLLGRQGDAADPYPSSLSTGSSLRIFNDSLTDYTIPRVIRNNGNLSGIRIENIKRDQTSGSVSFDFQRQLKTSTSQIVEVDSTNTDLVNGPGSAAIVAARVRQNGNNHDWLVTAELPGNIVLYKIDGQGNATSKRFEVDSFSKEVQLQSFKIANKNLVMVYDPYTAKTVILELKNGILEKVQDIKPDQTRYRRYMLLTTGEFLNAGELNFVGLDPFKNILDFYRIETDLKLTWLESHDVSQQIRSEVSWSAMESGKFGGASGLDDFCVYDSKQNEVVFLKTRPFQELDSFVFDRSDTNTPIRYDQLCSGNFFPTPESGLALFTSDKGLASIWFRNTANPNYDSLWTMPNEMSWMVSGDFLETGTDQVFLHRR